jgi:hypothetical protein
VDSALAHVHDNNITKFLIARRTTHALFDLDRLNSLRNERSLERNLGNQKVIDRYSLKQLFV